MQMEISVNITQEAQKQVSSYFDPMYKKYCLAQFPIIILDFRLILTNKMKTQAALRTSKKYKYTVIYWNTPAKRIKLKFPKEEKL